MKTLYIFLDESGNFDFSPSGTKYFILTALSTTLPFEIGSPLLKHRYDLLPIKSYAKTTFSLLFHDSKFDLCNQAVDYFGWAIYRKWDSKDLRSLR